MITPGNRPTVLTLKTRGRAACARALSPGTTDARRAGQCYQLDLLNSNQISKTNPAHFAYYTVNL